MDYSEDFFKKLSFFQSKNIYDHCLEAVKKDGNNINFIIKHVPHIINKQICLEAVRQNGHSIRFIKESPTLSFLLDKNIGLAAVGNNPHSYSYIRDCEFVDREFLDLFIEDLLVCKLVF